MSRLNLVLVAGALAACKASGATLAEHEAGPEAPSEHRGVAVAPPPPPVAAMPVVTLPDGGSASCVSLVAEMIERACDVHLTDAGEPPPPVPGKPSPVLITLLMGPPGTDDGGVEIKVKPYFPESAKCVVQPGLWSLPSACRRDLTLHFIGPGGPPATGTGFSQ
jgi:hypothetical protein